MIETTEGVERESRFRFNNSVNVPTLCTVVALLGAFWWWGTGVYSDLRMEDARNELKIEAVKGDVARVESQQISQGRDVRGDLHDINEKLDRLTDRLIPGSNPSQWMKK